MNIEKLLERAAAAREEATRAEYVAVKARERMVDYMRRAHQGGAGYDQIAKMVGLSKQRVGQLLNPSTPAERKARRDAKAAVDVPA